MYMEPPQVNKVINLINLLNLCKSVGHDNISPYFLRVASTFLHQLYVILLKMLFVWVYF